MFKPFRAALAVTALSFAFGAAYAQAATPAAGAQGMAAHAGHHGHRWHHHGGPLQLVKRLHDQLKLSAAQEQQYQSLLATAKQNRQQAREIHKQLFAQIKTQRDQAIIDFGAMHTAQQQAQQQTAQLREQTAQAWLAFYNGLTDAQKTTVSTAVKQQFAKMEAFHAKMKQHWQAKHAAPATGASQ